MEKIVAVSVLPVVLCGIVCSGAAMYRAGVPESAVIIGSSVLAALVVLLLQRLMPYAEESKGLPKHFRVDLVHVLSTALASAVFKASLFVGLVLLADWLSVTLGLTLWPGGWPMPLQLGVALVVGEFGSYWLHRLAHEHELVWRVHVMHHTSERLYVLTGARNHPFNVLLTNVAQLAPLILLGAHGEVLVLFAAFNSVNGLFQHANVRLNVGPLNWILSTWDLHRWHHSRVMGESCSNYGSNLIIWDIVFGTRYLPQDRAPTRNVGLQVPVPENVFTHLMLPFTWGYWSARVDPSTTDPGPAQPRIAPSGGSPALPSAS